MAPEVASSSADSVMTQADPDLAAGETTGNLRSGSLRKRGRAGKASVEGNGEAIPVPIRSSQRKRAKPEAAAEVESALAKSAPSSKSKAKGKAVAPKAKETVKPEAVPTKVKKGKGSAIEDDLLEKELLAEVDEEEGEDAVVEVEVVPVVPKRKAVAPKAKETLKAEAVLTKVKKGKRQAIEDELLEEELLAEVDDEEGGDAVVEVEVVPVVPKRKAVARKKTADDAESSFIGDPIPVELAKKLWPDRYQKKEAEDSSTKFEEDPDDVRAKRHYRQAKVDDVIYNLNDNVYVKAGDGEPDFIGRIIEFFEGVDKQCHFTSRWFYRAVDTVIQDHHHHIDSRRVFLSEDKNVNVLDCIVSKIKIVRVTPNIDLNSKKESIPDCDLYYDMSYSSKYSTFAVLPSDNQAECVGNSSPASSTSTLSSEDADPVALSPTPDVELSLLDLYSGCGAMSTGLCLGAKLSGINLVTKWAVDFNKFASESLRMNHPETQVRTEKAEDFLQLLREWEKMCNKYGLLGTEVSPQQVATSDVPENTEKAEPVDESDEDEGPIDGEEFEVGEFLDICYGDPNEINKTQLMFKVRWKGYGPDEDTWEPLEGLGNCDERIEAFVRNGFQKKILPLPGLVDTICGGPPCQGISGFNRFRNADAPLEDEKNKQMLVFMEIVEFLKPKHVLMENVVDILKFAKGFLGRYALCRLVQLNYQARLGILAAGSFGLPQFRMRCFLWGAQPSEKLPQFPLPTHDVVTRGGAPVAFEPNVVALDEKENHLLKTALLLEDAISDLPPVDNFEKREEMEYEFDPKTDFQRSIRLTREALLGIGDEETLNRTLFDHLPYKLNEDDFQRVCRIPKFKGANFRNLPGLTVGANNVIERIPNILELLPSGKPLVPEYALTFVKGKSLKPFGRLWWDETVATVVTRAEPHNQAILHPEQDRVLTVRENARLQGFPDYYKLYGPVSQKYMQVGNAVAVPVARALGYGLGLARQGLGDDLPVFSLPPTFPKPAVRSSVAVEMVEG